MEQLKPQRQADLLKSYEFNCDCTACVNDYPMPNKLLRVDKDFVLPRFGKFGTNTELLNEVKENFKFMSENSENHPCFETAAIIVRNKELIRTVCERVNFALF